MSSVLLPWTVSYYPVVALHPALPPPCRATVFVPFLTAKGTHTGRPGIFLPCLAFAEQNVQYILNVS